MSNLDRTPSLTYCDRGGVATRPAQELFNGREVLLGESTVVRRVLPNLGRRLVGPWCFIDHYGPDDIAGQGGMQVPPHPHMGLQTVSWLLDGRVHHRDSLGSDAIIEPGQLGLMTSGAGIAHAEYSPLPHPDLLHGVQLWVALPSATAGTAPAWAHHVALPTVSDEGLHATVILGSLAGSSSPGTTHSPLVGVAVTLHAGAGTRLPLEPDFEHAALVLAGSADVDGVPVPIGSMLYLGTGRSDVALRSDRGAELLLLGGEPFGEDIVMWWNFVGHSNDEIVEARAQWTAGERFGTVTDAGEPLVAPPLPPGALKPRGATR